jgi:putative endonuclease
MSFYVYIIQSKIDGSYYKGYSEEPVLRLSRHNNGETVSTRHLLPWKLVYVELHSSKTEALRREKNIKRATRERIAGMIGHEQNIVSNFDAG